MNNPIQEESSREKTLWIVVIPQIIIITICILWIAISPGDNVLPYLSFNSDAILKGLLVGIALASFGYAFYKFSKKTKIFYETTELFEKVLYPTFKSIKLFDVILLSSITGFAEEIFFRGLLFPKIGLILSSLAFGILHMPGKKYWIYSVWATGSGALFAWLFDLTGSLWLPITAHIINNIIGMIMLLRLGKDRR